MTKLQFLLHLHKKLSGLPQKDIEERLNFYSEMIEDRMEEGLSEKDAVAAIGSVDEIAAQILADFSLPKAKTNRQRRVWHTVLLVLGSPLWFSLLIAAFSVVLSLYVSVWAVIVSFWSIFGSVAACAFAGILSGVVFTCCVSVPVGIAMVGIGIVCTGLSILLFLSCKAVTSGTALLTKKFTRWIKNRFVGKEHVS